MRLAVTSAAIGALFLTACQTEPGGMGQREGIGTLGGAVVGGVLGNQIGHGSGRVAATAIGALAGGLIGNRVGANMDQQARQQALAAEYQALEYGAPGRPVQWQASSGNYRGEIVPGQTYQINSVDCRDYAHTIYIEGSPQVARGTACRQPDGTWRPVS
ncbi:MULTISPECIES: glycine zipper 2TM domain-containing protein [Afifella]|uniref:glycine zipper 2TM domain-containing protein n=1 Tax=Afifella TaxID=643217 RepID=UPI00196A95FE|nr:MULTISPECIES: glycine zipper 2TM domain-containing protein [Afifella]MCT8266753.1 glycine zipper 2TM domain-containing protein [Afifella sp. JA880]